MSKFPPRKDPPKKSPPKKDPPKKTPPKKYYSTAQTKSKAYKTRGGGQQHVSDSNYSIEKVMEAPVKGGGKGPKVVTGRGSMHDPIHGVADLLNLQKD